MTSWSIDPVLPVAILLPLLGVLIVLSFSIEWRRKLSRKVLRLVCLGLLFLAVAGLFLRPSYESSGTASAIALLTNGFDPSELDSLQKIRNLNILHTPEAAQVSGAKEITSFAELSSIGPEIHYVLGEGLPPFAFDYFKPSFTFLPGRVVEGVLSIQVSPEARPKRRSQLTGELRSDHRIQWLRLQGPGGAVDSVKTGTSSGFSLSFSPKLPGRFLYQLQMLDSNLQVLDSLRVPVAVLPERKLSVLILQQFPTFETRYLKNLLADQGHSVAVRSRVSENDYRYEFANRNTFSFGRLNDELLAATDMLLVDQGSLALLSNSEENFLKNAVQDGLGVLVWATELPQSRRLTEWMPFSFQSVSRDTSHLRTEDGRAILAVPPFRIEPGPGTYPVWEAGPGQLLAAYSYRGRGIAATVLWADSYRLVLSGQERLHANLWMGVIDAVARKENSCCKLEIQSEAPHFVDEPLHFQLLSDEVLPKVYYHGVRVPLKENWQLANVWEGTIWPQAFGWDSLTVDGMDRPVYWYVNQPGEWTSIVAAERVRLNTIMAGISGDEKRQASEEAKKRVPQLIFFLLFLLAAGGLWLAPKI